MLPLFRKIRYRLAKDNQFLKYSRYAIGEIILVVLGIIIAFQINNWKENRSLNALTKTYLFDIKKDLIADTITFNSGITRIEKSLEKQERLFNSDFINGLSTDSLMSSIYGTFHSARIYKINNSTFLKLTNSGFVESKPYNNILIEINDYYTKEFSTWSEFLEWDKQNSKSVFSREALNKWYDEIDLIDLIYRQKTEFKSDGKLRSELAIKKYLKSPHFRNYAWTMNDRMRVILERMKHQKRVATELIKNIDAVLNVK